MVKMRKGFLEEAMALVRIRLFLRYDCGLKHADQLNASDLRRLLRALKTGKKG